MVEMNDKSTKGFVEKKEMNRCLKAEVEGRF